MYKLYFWYPWSFGKWIYKGEFATNKEVTDEQEWYIDILGRLFYMTDDINCPLYEADEEYYYTLEIAVLK